MLDTVLSALDAAGLPASRTYGAAKLYAEGGDARVCVYRSGGQGTAADLSAALAVLRAAGLKANPGRDRVVVRPA
jgi:hypothetical protein